MKAKKDATSSLDFPLLDKNTHLNITVDEAVTIIVQRYPDDAFLKLVMRKILAEIAAKAKAAKL
jgi:hypothetical protein